ncbi:hypothetical protein J3A83DRAFT_669779 [Scleroderma citrinum]
MSDENILARISTFLTTQCREMSQHTRFIYLHRINDTRVGGTSKCNIRKFLKFCSRISFKNVVIVTTMWDKVTPEVGEQREQELMSSDELFKPLLDRGAVMARHDGTRESARKVIEDLLKRGVSAQIDHEHVIGKRDTEAGIESQSDVPNIFQGHHEDLQRLGDAIREAIQQRDKRTEVEVAEDRRKVDDIARLHGEPEELGNGTDTKHMKRRWQLQKKRNPADASTCQAIEIGGTNKQAKMSKSLPATTGGDFRRSGDANAHTTRRFSSALSWP